MPSHSIDAYPVEGRNFAIPKPVPPLWLSAKLRARWLHVCVLWLSGTKIALLEFHSQYRAKCKDENGESDGEKSPEII